MKTSQTEFVTYILKEIYDARKSAWVRQGGNYATESREQKSASIVTISQHLVMNATSICLRSIIFSSGRGFSWCIRTTLHILYTCILPELVIRMKYSWILDSWWMFWKIPTALQKIAIQDSAYSIYDVIFVLTKGLHDCHYIIQHLMDQFYAYVSFRCKEFFPLPQPPSLPKTSTQFCWCYRILLHRGISFWRLCFGVRQVDEFC